VKNIAALRKSCISLLPSGNANGWCLLMTYSEFTTRKGL